MGAKWKGPAGLASDVRYYGEWMRSEARRRIGHLYPKVKLPPEHGGGEATVIATRIAGRHRAVIARRCKD